MAGISVSRVNGRWSVKAQGCCGNTAAWQREYNRTFLEQTLADGGEIVSQSDAEIVVRDRKGRTHAVTV
jgi:hypothetical protein